jgi:hypothetical protein
VAATLTRTERAKATQTSISEITCAITSDPKWFQNLFNPHRIAAGRKVYHEAVSAEELSMQGSGKLF